MYRKISPFFNDSIFVSLPEFWHLNFIRGRNLSAHCERSVGRIPKIPGLCYFLKPIKFAHYVSVNNILYKQTHYGKSAAKEDMFKKKLLKKV